MGMTMKLQPLFVGLVCHVVPAWLAVSAAAAEPAQEETPAYVRLQRGEHKEPRALETAIVRFASTDPQRRNVTVDLIGAIHVADRPYFETLNQRFKQYDAVLYELVARPEAKVPKPDSPPGTVVGGVQVGMTALLGLSFQLDHIDYAAKNMVHADMTPEEFDASMERRNESFLAMFFRVMGRGLADQTQGASGPSDLQVLAALFAPDRTERLKRIMAEQFVALDGDLDMFDGPEGSTLVTERNKRALQVLERELARGKQRLAIFYGAGHLPDLQRRLEKDFAMHRTRTEWLTAWSLTPATPAAAPAQPAPAGDAGGRRP